MTEPAAFGRETLDALVAAIDVNDLVDLDAPLPAALLLDGEAEQLARGFRLSRQLWREGFDPAAVAAIAARLGRGAPASDDAARLKQVRARFKHLRFAFFLYAAAHRSPPLLSLVTLELGELQDATRVRPHAVARRAAGVRLLLSPPPRALLRRETRAVALTDPAGFRRFTAAQIASLRPVLATPAIGAHAFHAARKVVSRLVSFHDDMRVLGGDPAHRDWARWLATLNGLMGRHHDELVASAAAGGFDYRRERFAMPVEIAGRLAALVALLPGTSSSSPPAA